MDEKNYTVIECKGEFSVEKLIYEAGILEAVKRLLRTGKYVAMDDIRIILGISTGEE